MPAGAPSRGASSRRAAPVDAAFEWPDASDPAVLRRRSADGGLARFDRAKLRTFEPRLLLPAGDAAVAAGAGAGALLIWSAADGVPFTWTYVWSHAVWLWLAPPWLLLLLPAYRTGAAYSVRTAAAVAVRAAVGVAGLYLLVYFLSPRDLLPRIVVLSFLALAAPSTVAWRAAAVRLFLRGRRGARVAIVGAGAAAREIGELLRARAPHSRVTAFVSSPGQTAWRLPGTAAVAGAAGLERLVAEGQASELVLTREAARDDELLRAVVRAQQRGVEVVHMQTLYEEMLGRVPVRHLDPDRTLSSLAGVVQRGKASETVKRAVDVAAGGVGCVLLALLLPVLVPAIWLDVGRPAFFRQRRAGLSSRPFALLKFRTMGLDAERDGPQWASDDDARTSRFGRFLRKSRLDETPQFWNVLKGDMSLIGPRPERPEFVEQLERLIPFYRERLMVRPGLTGWAQVNFRYGSSVDDSATKLEYDLYYVKRRSLLFDLLIALRTVGTVLRFAGR